MELTGRIQAWGDTNSRNRLADVAITVLFHVVAVVALLQYEPVRSAFTDAMPIMVSLITPQPVVEKPAAPPKLDPQPELHLRANKTTQYQALAEVMAAAGNAGLTRVGVVPDPNVH